jgi:tripartite ATP-independent transporter DctP family solute receptor
VLTLALASGAQAQIVMRNSISVAQNSHQGVGVDVLAAEVEKRTNGRIIIKNFYSGSLGGERESIESVQLGTQELAGTSTGPIPNFVPAVRILDIPFLFRDKAHARAVLDGPIGDALLKEFDSKGFKALAWSENGVRHMTNSKRPVNTPDDLKGLKMRTMENPVHVAAYKGFGIITTPMAFPEVFTALQQGVVDGQENPLSVIMAAKFEQVQKYMTLTGHVYSPAIYLMNKAAFDKLSPADKQAFLDAAKIASAAQRARVDQDDAQGVAYLRSKGMTVNENVDKAAFVAKLAPVFAQFEKDFGKDKIDAIRNYK